MKKFLVLLAVLIPAGSLQGATIIDHTCTELDMIPSEWIDNVQSDLKSHYAHTSHGSQLTWGLTFVEQGSSEYAFDIGSCNLPSTAGAYCIFDGQESQTYITPELYWETPAGLQLTRDVLDNNPALNTSMWCWCTQCDYYDQSQVQAYLDAMTLLESEYPDVTFIYFTGNAQGVGADGYNRWQRNNQIRDYCIAGDKVLYDFADLDAWWYNPSTEQWEHHTYSYGGYDVPAEHPQFYGDEYGHTTAESCEQKGRSWWWMAALLAGWSGTGISGSEPLEGYSLEVVSSNPSSGPFNLSYTIPAEGEVSLRLYSITGRLTDHLASGIHCAGGHQVTIEGSGEGVYFVRMTSGAFCATEMLVMLD